MCVCGGNGGCEQPLRAVVEIGVPLLGERAEGELDLGVRGAAGDAEHAERIGAHGGSGEAGGARPTQPEAIHAPPRRAYNNVCFHMYTCKHA